MGIADHLTCLLRNLYAGQEAKVSTRHGTTDKHKTRKGVCQDYILSPCLFNLYAEHIVWKAKLDEAQAGRNIKNLRYAYDTTLMAESKREIKRRVKKLAWNSTFRKLRSWHHFMANKWGKNGISDRLYFGVLQNHCMWWLQPRN